MAAASSNGSISSGGSGNNNNNNNTTSIINNNNIETDEFIKKSRVTRAAPPKPAYDPLQFVQIKPAKLYDLNKAKPSNERKVLEVKAHREVEDAEEWQCNLDSWKSSRRKRVEHIIDKITEAKKIEQEEVYRGRKKSKTFSEMLENSGSRRRFILPGAEDDDEGGSFSDDPQEPGDAGSKQQYKDESTDDRATDDTGSCCSSKHLEGGSKTPDFEDTQPAPEMNEFSLAIENYKSKFPMTQGRMSSLNGGNTTVNAYPSVSSSIESNNDHEASIAGEDGSSGVQSPVVENSLAQRMSSLTMEQRERVREQQSDAPVSGTESSSLEIDDEPPQQKMQDDTPKVNVIERRRVFEQFQQMGCLTDTAPPAANGGKCSQSGSSVGQDDRFLVEDGSTCSQYESTTTSSEWFAAGSIKERRAIFERYQSNEMIAEEQQEHGGGRSRSSSTIVVKSRSESNVGFVNGSTGRFELALTQLKRNGADYCEDSGIQSTTDLSRSSVVSQADDSEPSMLLLPDDVAVGKSPTRSTTLDSASEFSDTDCSNGQLLDNALDVAFEEMDSELNESCMAEDEDTHQEQNRQAEQDTAIAPLSVVNLAPAFDPVDKEFGKEPLDLMTLPASALTPPKEKPPPPPEDDEPDLESSTLAPGSTIVTSWIQKHTPVRTNGSERTHGNALLVESNPSDGYEQSLKHAANNGQRQQELLQLASDQWKSLESYEVVQQVQHQQQKQHEPEKGPQERDKDQQELMVYSNRIQLAPHHQHQLYDPGEHEEMVSVERELLQIEQEELQRRREKQMLFEKLTKADQTPRGTEQPIPQQQLQNQMHQQPKPMQQPRHPQHAAYYYAHHHPHHQAPNHHLNHHRASMPTIDSRSLQNVNAYGSFEAPFLDDMHSYEMGSLHRESMPNLSNVHVASSSHPSSLSSYGEEYSANSATSFDGSCWPPVDPRQGENVHVDKRPAVAPRPVINGFLDRTTLPPGVVGYPATGGGQRLSSNMFEQHPKDSNKNPHHPAMVNRGQTGAGTNSVPYGQHWLVQEAEQRRIEQHQKSNTNSTKRPLPKFVIDAITQRVQKLNAASPENSDRSNLSEDSDLAMINSMKHHHHPHHHPHHPTQSIPPHHHQQQQPLPPLPSQQQKYSNASDKVLSVSGKKECSHCRIELGKGAAMAIESLGLFYHIECFKCCVCHVKLGDGTNGIDVRVRKYRLHCQNCFSSEDGVKFSCV
ncbi:uncharacterized protein LOC128730572 [Anopheles nili]|uniref:uncharacterized protein LOC128730572 n=1 Tax=Anopheles nili TaxID=185578 RepID=UPI00237BAB07|nr:uncharacterized protein LOC128730572 [Anopheles nili]